MNRIWAQENGSSKPFCAQYVHTKNWREEFKAKLSAIERSQLELLTINIDNVETFFKTFPLSTKVKNLPPDVQVDLCKRHARLNIISLIKKAHIFFANHFAHEFLSAELAITGYPAILFLTKRFSTLEYPLINFSIANGVSELTLFEMTQEQSVDTLTLEIYRILYFAQAETEALDLTYSPSMIPGDDTITLYLYLWLSFNKELPKELKNSQRIIREFRPWIERNQLAQNLEEYIAQLTAIGLGSSITNIVKIAKGALPHYYVNHRTKCCGGGCTDCPWGTPLLRK